MSDDMLPLDSPALLPERQQVVNFYGDTIPAAQTADEQIYVPLRPICDHLGLDWSSQSKRLKRDPLLLESSRSVVMMTTDRGERAMTCLPLDLLPGWLFGVNVGRVKPELQEKIARYRRECFRVLWNAFKDDILPAPAAITPGLGGAALALEIAEGIAALARQQLALESRIDTMADFMRPFVQETRQRLQALELQLSSGTTISEAQAAEIALAVKNVGQRLVAGGSRDGYARVYAEMYRRYRISGYKNLPAPHFEEVITWLHGWYDELAPPS